MFKQSSDRFSANSDSFCCGIIMDSASFYL
jgi:hypothetical protein